jgi:hypothetical protein
MAYPPYYQKILAEINYRWRRHEWYDKADENDSMRCKNCGLTMNEAKGDKRMCEKVVMDEALS